MTTNLAVNGRPRSFLVADCGYVNTTVALLDIAEGSYQLVTAASAPTTVTAPWLDIIVGLRAAVAQITAITGRPLLNDRGGLITPLRENGVGVDGIAVVTSAGAPVTTWLVGLFDEISLASGRQALKRAYTREIGHFSLSNGRSLSQQLNDFIANPPDFVLIVGGVDGGAEEQLVQLVETVGLAADILTGSARMRVIYAGNIGLRERVRKIVGQSASLQMAQNVRPTPGTEAPEDTARLINELYVDLKVHRLPGIQGLLEWSSEPPQSAAQAFANIGRYLAHLYKGCVVGVDIGSHQVTLLAATADNVAIAVASDLGMGHSAANLLTQIAPTAVQQWLPFAIPTSEIQDYLANKSLYPHTIPTTERDLLLDQAIARELLRCAASTLSLPAFSLLVARGRTLTHAPRPGQTALMLLDALQPTGLFAIASDAYNILPGLSALASQEPVAVVQALEAGILTHLGWVVVPVGTTHPGEKVLDIVIQQEQTQRFEAEVEYGNLELFPLTHYQAAEVILRPRSSIDIGLGPGHSRKIKIRGGSLGLIVDARGRPLRLPTPSDERQRLIRQWRQDISG